MSFFFAYFYLRWLSTFKGYTAAYKLQIEKSQPNLQKLALIMLLVDFSMLVGGDFVILLA